MLGRLQDQCAGQTGSHPQPATPRFPCRSSAAIVIIGSRYGLPLVSVCLQQQAMRRAKCGRKHIRQLGGQLCSVAPSTHC